MDTTIRKTDLTREELRELLAERVRRRLGMSLEEFREARARGTFPDDGNADLDVLAGERQSSDRRGG